MATKASSACWVWRVQVVAATVDTAGAASVAAIPSGAPMFDKTRVMTVAKRLMDGSVDAEQFYKDLTLVLAEETGATRASLWCYPDPLLRDRIECLSLYDRTDKAWSAGAVLSENDFGPYFEAMRRDNMIVAGDARHHPVTDCFNEIYFDPLGIVSLLDVGITVAGEPFGLFCCENTTELLHWTPEHVEFLRQVGTLLGFALRKARAAVPAAA
jgi:GAF domain-containing protein